MKLRLPVLAMLIGAMFIPLALAASAASFPYTTLHRLLPKRITVQLKQFIGIQQGWSFFTRNPREADLYYFKPIVSGGLERWHNAMLRPHSSLEEGFGIVRYSRTQALEAGQLSTKVRPSAWVHCDEPEPSCFQIPQADKIVNTFLHPTLCGEILMVKQAPVPHAYSKTRPQGSWKLDVARVEVTCVPISS